jgi:multidrug efflux pump subunit AcrA (membrane-fusion protein)
MQQKKQELDTTVYSEEVQVIMGSRPEWILRWGITIIIIILWGIIVACYFIKYPQTVTASIFLTSDNPPSDLAAKAIGILDSVYVADGEEIQKGQLIALIASAVKYEDMVIAEELLTADDLLTKADVSRLSSLQLGDLQEGWIEYLSICSDYQDYLQIDKIGRKKALLAEQINREKEYCAKLEAQRQILAEDLVYEKRSLQRDSIMLANNLIAQAEYEKTLKSFLSKKNVLAGFDASMTSAYLSRLQTEQQILELNTQKTMETSEYERLISQAKSTLIGQVSLWKEQYAIIAPYDGCVSLQNVWSRGQRVSAGDIIASVAPSGGATIIGRLKVPSSGFGKVNVGQQVNIKLNGFPYLEFGIVKGTVASISSVPENTQEGLTYTVDVIFPDGLESTYHKVFPFVQNMDGNAEIVTEDMRLIEQFIRPIQSLFVNR